MKKYFIILLFLSLITKKEFAQNVSYGYYSDADIKSAWSYSQVKNMLLADGYTISQELYADLQEGGTTYKWKTYTEGNDYIIVAVSDDDDVLDLDLYLYNSNLDLYDSDDERDDIAIIHYSPYYTKQMKVVVKNSSSYNAGYAHRCKFIIAYK